MKIVFHPNLENFCPLCPQFILGRPDQASSSPKQKGIKQKRIKFNITLLYLLGCPFCLVLERERERERHKKEINKKIISAWYEKRKRKEN